jgi:hypothetical protein
MSNPWYSGSFHAIDGNRARARDVEAMDGATEAAFDGVKAKFDAVDSLIAGSPFMSAASTSTLTIAEGAISFVTERNKAISPTQALRIAPSTDLTKWMVLIVSSYNSSTGATTGTVVEVQGTGTFSSWILTSTGTSGIPTPIGQADKVLTSNGTSASWQLPNNAAIFEMGII